MPYNYRKSTRRFRKSANRFAKRAAPYASMAARALMTANRVASLINVEKKYLDTLSNGTTLTASPGGTMVLLNAMAQGDTSSTREGSSCKAVYLYVEGFCILNATSQDIIRIGFLNDRQANGAAATYASVFDANSTGPIARRNTGNGYRYKILKERTVTLDTGGKTIVQFRMYKKLSIHTRYNPVSNTGTIADINTNALYLYFAGNLAATMSTINYAVRYRFIDN